MKPAICGLSLALTTVLATMGSGDSATAQNPASTALIIQGGTLIDGNGGAPVPNSVILMEGNRITAAGRAGQVQIPAGAKIITGASNKAHLLVTFPFTQMRTSTTN